MSWAAVAAGGSIGTSASTAGIDLGKTHRAAISVAGKTSGGGSNMLVNNAPPAEVAAGGQSVPAAGAVESLTGTTLGKKKKRYNKKKKVAAVVEGSSATPRDSPDLTKTDGNSQTGDSKKGAAKGKNKTSLGGANAAVKPSPAGNKDAGNRLSACGSTEGDLFTAAAPKKHKKKGRQTQNTKNPGELEAVPTENKKQSAQMQQFEHSLGNRQKGPSVVDTCNPDVKVPQSTSRPTVILTKPAPVLAAGQQGPLNALKNPLSPPETTGPSHKHSTSVRFPSENQQKNPPSPSRSLPSKIPSPRAFVASLNLPGISYDHFGICIAASAPQWVRGRIARRVQILVSEVEQGILDSAFDPALELELEKKEKAFFGGVIWNRLYEVDFRGKRSSRALLREYAEMGPLMRAFDGKMEGEREWRGGEMGADMVARIKMIGDQNADKMAEIRRSLEEASRRNIRLPQAVGMHPSEGEAVAMTLTQDFVSRGAPLNLGLPTRPPPPPPPPQMRLPGSRSTTNNGWTYKDAHTARMMHSPPPPPPPSFPHRHTPHTPQLCHHYAQNKCHYGPTCRFLHVLPHELELGPIPPPIVPRDNNNNNVPGFSHPALGPFTTTTAATPEGMPNPSEAGTTWMDEVPGDVRGGKKKNKDGGRKGRWKAADRKVLRGEN